MEARHLVLRHVFLRLGIWHSLHMPHGVCLQPLQFVHFLREGLFLGGALVGRLGLTTGVDSASKDVFGVVEGGATGLVSVFWGGEFTSREVWFGAVGGVLFSPMVIQLEGSGVSLLGLVYWMGLVVSRGVRYEEFFVLGDTVEGLDGSRVL